MDSRNSSTTVAASPAHVAIEGQSVNDDGVFALAKEAALYFQARKYAECLQLLKQLLLKKPSDPKVLHNIAVTEYFSDGCSDLRKLLGKLYDVKKGSEEARGGEDPSAAGNNTVKKSGSVSKGGNTMMLEEDKNVQTGVSDTSVASLNISLIWYHLHEYAKALSILEPIYQNIEPLDESIALQICLLLLDAGFALQNAIKFADVLSYLEKAFYVNHSSSSIPFDAANTGNQQSSNIAAKSTSVSSASDMGNVDATTNSDTVENTLSRTMSEETINYENLLSTLDTGRDDISKAGGLSTSSNPSRSLLAPCSVNIGT